MDNDQLFESLLLAEEESEVEKILEEAGYGLSNEEAWKPYGDLENNFSTVGNQKTEATDALVEKIINSIDAVLMAECHSRGIDPESSNAPVSMGEAVEKFFGVRGGRLENLDAAEQTVIADRINIVATGSRSSPSYLIIDSGEGQTPSTFPDTFLSLHQSNKMRIPFVQGRFNTGGTGVFQFCGEQNMQLIVSRRHPEAPVPSNDRTRDLWGFTLVRRVRPSAGRRSSMYVYLRPGGNVLNFQKDVIKVLPQKRSQIHPEPYSVGLPHGTCIKLYNYRWKGRTIATLEGRYELERYLHLPCLPFRLTETRDYDAHYFSTTVSGVWATVGSSNDLADSKAESGFPAYGWLNLKGIGTLPYRMVVFSEKVNPKHFPKGVFFTINGQVHGDLPANFVSHSLKFEYLRNHLLVSVDCTEMESAVREDFFMASRDRVRKNEVYHEILDQLKDALREHQGLRDLNAIRRKKEIDRAISNETDTVNAFNDILKRDPSLAALFSAGDRLITRTGPGEPTPFLG